ncbi:MAG: CPBP family intramembrane metalloprotease [Clostridiales bacterium]|nr:CPBP family intramembrane metalloprotease [Clostridiales bacterium]
MPQYYYDPYGGRNFENDEQMRQMYYRQQQEKAEKKELRKLSTWLGIAIILYLVIQTVVSLVLTSTNLYDTYCNSAIFQYAFNIIFVSVLSVAVPFGIAALVNKKKYTHPIIPSKPIKASHCFAWVCFGMGCCIIANYVVSFIQVILSSLFNVTLSQSESLAPDSIFACILDVIGIAIIPALCEEFAMRCCSLQLLRKYGTGFAVFAVSVVFGLLHGNVIQFLFAFLIGMVLGFITVKTESIVPAILIHMFNNGMSVVSDVTTYALGEDAASNSTVIMFLFWIIAGIIAGIYLFFKKQLSFKFDKNTSVLSFWQKLASFLFPGMIIPFLVLISLTATTVSIG